MSRIIVVLPLLVAVVLSCSSRGPASRSDTPAQPPEAFGALLVTVNGTPIGEEDLRYKRQSLMHNDMEVIPGREKDLLESIISEELVFQKAVELGLETDPTYQEGLRRLEVQLKAFKRKELGRAFWRQAAANVNVSEAEAREYFETAPVRTELHVWQLMVKGDEGQIQQALRDLQSGVPFEEIAKRKYPKLPADMTPWDLGYLKWKQIPPSWQKVIYDLKVGETSGIIQGPKKRSWIIKLIDKREAADVEFKTVEPAIVEVLKARKIADHLEQTKQDLLREADIVYPGKRPPSTTE